MGHLPSVYARPPRRHRLPTRCARPRRRTQLRTRTMTMVYKLSSSSSRPFRSTKCVQSEIGADFRRRAGSRFNRLGERQQDRKELSLPCKSSFRPLGPRLSALPSRGRLLVSLVISLRFHRNDSSLEKLPLISTTDSSRARFDRRCQTVLKTPSRTLSGRCRDLRPPRTSRRVKD